MSMQKFNELIDELVDEFYYPYDEVVEVVTNTAEQHRSHYDEIVDMD